MNKKMKQFILISIILLTILAGSTIQAATYGGTSEALRLHKASGYLFFGNYLGKGILGAEGRKIKYAAGIYLEIESKLATYFMKDETFISDIDAPSAYPKQINYTIGVKKRYDNLEIILTHECLHPVDGASNGRQASSYSFIEGRLNF